MITTGQLRTYGALNMPEDNVSLTGGDIDVTCLVDFSDIQITGRLQVVCAQSESATITIYGRLGNGIISNETVAIGSPTPVPTVQTAWERIMKVIKSAPTNGYVSIETVTPTYSATLNTSGTTDTITLPNTASTTDNAYVSMVFRITAGTGAGTIAEVLYYDGSGQVVTLDQAVTFDSTSVIIITAGVVMPPAIVKSHRPFYNVVANPSNGADLTYYEKFFWRNNASLDALQSAMISEVSNPTGNIQFAVDTGGDNTSSIVNRLTAPIIAGLAFSRLPQGMPGVSPDMAPGQAVGVWMSFFVRAGQVPVKSSYATGLTGQTT